MIVSRVDLDLSICSLYNLHFNIEHLKFLQEETANFKQKVDSMRISFPMRGFELELQSHVKSNKIYYSPFISMTIYLVPRTTMIVNESKVFVSVLTEKTSNL